MYECPVIKNTWQLIKQRYQNLAIPDLTPESDFFEFKHNLFLNQIHIIFRIAVYTKKDSDANHHNRIYKENRGKSDIFRSQKKKESNKLKWARLIQIEPTLD